MKFKSILLSLLFPLSVFGATNAFDNVKINTSLKLPFGSPAAGRIFTSDAVGFGSWSNAPASAAGGDVFTTSNNTFIATKTNTYNGVAIFTNTFTATGSNTITGQLFINRGATRVYNLDLNSWFDNSGVYAIDINPRVLYDSSTVASVGWDGRVLNDTGGNTTVHWNSRFLANAGVNVLDWASRELRGSSWTVTNNFTVNRNLTVSNNLSVVGTNYANAFGILSTGNIGFSGAITNISTLSTNVHMYHFGILTNALRNPPAP